jgi:hypothetical protein
MIAFMKSAGIIVGLLFGIVLLAAISAQLALGLALALLILSLVAVFRPISKLRLGHRAFSLAVLIFVGLPASLGTLGHWTQQQDLIALRAANPAAYLEALKRSSTDRWLAEMQILAPEQYRIEAARIAEEDARKQAEAQVAAAEREAERKAKAEVEAAERRAAAARRTEENRIKAEAEAIATRARECGDKNEISAFVMSQEFVKRRLRAPSTADFPSWPSEYTSRALGDCKYQVASYVDAQNGFGAMIRSRYSATLILHPAEGSWSALDVTIFE